MLRRLILFFLLSALPLTPYLADAAPADSDRETGGVMGRSRELSAASCGSMEVWDYDMAMCMPRAMAGMDMHMLMLNYNSFFLGDLESGPRGRSAFSVPDVVMADLGTNIGDRNYINLDYMATVEKWLYPSSGTPELLQIGEEQENGSPYLDAQHPHNSPVMGLTISDTISFGSGDRTNDHAKLWFSPRGQSTDGPVAFMHRPTGMMIPDAPLGHHIGQDVGHISSTVFGGSVRLNNTTMEVSTFNGTEPRPWAVDLPMNTPNSYAARLIQQFKPHLYAMISLAYVRQPESDDPDLDHVWRTSASDYFDRELAGGWQMHNAFIWGLINGYDHASALNSFDEEFWFDRGPYNIWGRIELLQRTPAELEISSANPNDPQWVSALSLGYTHRCGRWEAADVGVGFEFTEDLLPAAYQSAYGGWPVTGKVFVQVGGSKMWDL